MSKFLTLICILLPIVIGQNPINILPYPYPSFDQFFRPQQPASALPFPGGQAIAGPLSSLAQFLLPQSPQQQPLPFPGVQQLPPLQSIFTNLFNPSSNIFRPNPTTTTVAPGQTQVPQIVPETGGNFREGGEQGPPMGGVVGTFGENRLQNASLGFTTWAQLLGLVGR